MCLLSVACGSIGRAGQPVSSSPTPIASASSSNVEPAYVLALSNKATAIRIYAQRAYPNAYAGVKIQSEERDLVVYRRPTAGFDAAIRKQVPDTKIEFRDARFSAQTLQALGNQILADAPYWRSQGIQVSVVTALSDGSAVQVGTPNPEFARVPLEARYGPDRIRVIKQIVDDGVMHPSPQPTA